MKLTVAVLMTALALVGSLSAAETTVKLTKVHLCCDGCVAGVQKAVGTVPGVTAAVEKGAGLSPLTPYELSVSLILHLTTLLTGFFLLACLFGL